MKKGLLVLALLMMVSTVEATIGTKPNSKKGYFITNNIRPIQFTERGIDFYIYADGSLDFNTYSRYRTQYYYRNGRRYEKRNAYRGVRIDRDFYGRVRSVGNVFINYNHYGKVSRVGSVFVDYYRGRRLRRVGGLQIEYSRYGVRYYGQVKPTWHRNYRFDDDYIYDYDDDFFFEDDFFDNYEEYDEDDSYYYYKSKGKRGLKNSKTIKRRKSKPIQRERFRKKD